MTIGIIPNINKENILEVISRFINHLNNYGFDYLVDEEISKLQTEPISSGTQQKYLHTSDVINYSDIIVSIGGDGTMLHTAYLARNSNKPILGLNIGKLGFLAEFELNRIDELLSEIKNGEYRIEERIVLEGECISSGEEKLFAINDVVIDKGGWLKMIELSVKVDDEYVTTFAADGLILATPTGSTGYSLSTGGPVVSPTSDVITLSPISPHSLTMRPLVLDSNHKIRVKVNSPHRFVKVNCDGQRVYNFTPDCEVLVYKSDKRVKLIHTHSTKYFKILREKLFWGIDIRKNNV